MDKLNEILPLMHLLSHQVPAMPWGTDRLPDPVSCLSPISMLTWDWNLITSKKLNRFCSSQHRGQRGKHPRMPSRTCRALHQYQEKGRRTSPARRGPQRQKGKDTQSQGSPQCWVKDTRASRGASPQLQPSSPSPPHSCAFKGLFNHVSQTQILNYYFKWWASYFLKHSACTEAENGQSVVSFMKLFLSFRNQSGKPLMAWAFFSLSVTTLMTLI